MLVDGEPIAPSTKLAVGSTVDVALQLAAPALMPEDVPFDVLFEDELLAVIDKPAGVVVHPGAGHRSGTLAAGILARWPEVEGIGAADRWGIVHRLDRFTSGALLVAKTTAALEDLQGQLAKRTVSRTYDALVVGRPTLPTGSIDAPLGRDPRYPTRFRVSPSGKPAVTHYRVERSWERPPVALLEVSLETGRTHQIRVHLASIDLPVAGDGTYGRGTPREADPGRTFLHASRLRFVHPAGGDEREVVSPLPRDLEQVLLALG